MKKIKFICAVLMLVSVTLCVCSCNINSYIKPYNLVSKNSDKETKLLFDWLLDVYGKKTIAGQQVYYSSQSEEAVIYEVTGGKLPAIMGFDMLNQTGTNTDSQVDMAIAWHTESNGIVTFCWHWSPKTSTKGAYSQGNMYSLKKVLENKDSLEYADLISDIDKIAEQLKRLQDNHVPVLWRPLHEAAGGWFWWGASGPQYYKELWNIMFDRLENYHKLTNLIWVWNGQDEDWYVGDDKCDIAGNDSYFVKDTALSQRTYDCRADFYGFNRNVNWTNNKKMVALSEVDQLPNPDGLYELDYIKEKEPVSEREQVFGYDEWIKKDNLTTPWLYACAWWGGIITTEEFNKYEDVSNFYNSEYVITLDQLPEWDDDTRRELGRGSRNAG